MNNVSLGNFTKISQKTSFKTSYSNFHKNADLFCKKAQSMTK